MSLVSPRRRALVHLLARWLLDLDRPLPAMTDAELDAFVQRNLRWNLVVNVLDGMTFWFGLSFASSTTILPLFVTKLADSPALLTLLAILSQSGWYLPQILAASFTERMPRKKAVVVNLGFFTERLPMWLLPLAAWISPTHPMLALGLFFLAYAWHGMGAGIIAPAWTDLIARCFPVSLRGRFFGLTSTLGTGLGTAGAVLSGWILARYPYPTDFVIIFAIAAGAITLSWAFLALTREPARQEDRPVDPSGRPRSWTRIRSILAQDHNFRNYLGAQFWASLSLMSLGFVTAVALHRWQVSDATVGYFTGAMLVGQTVGNLGAGFLADRRGHKRSHMASLVGLAVANGLALLAPSPLWYFPVFFLFGAGVGSRIVSNVLMPLEFSRPEVRPTYVGMANTLTGVASTLAPVLGGYLYTVGFHKLYGLAALLAVLALVLLATRVEDPRYRAVVQG